MTFDDDLARQVMECAAARPPRAVLLLGLTPAAWRIRAALREAYGTGLPVSVVDPDRAPAGRDGVLPWRDVVSMDPDLVVVADDARKEPLLRALLPLLPDGPPPAVVIAGTAHLCYDDPGFAALNAPALVPSYANGYENTRVHMYQCLVAAAANGLRGAVVEFGAFKGGTTAWLARTAKSLNLPGPVIAFDSWDGFPAPRTFLDMYAHPRCVFTDLAAVRAHLEPLGVELVPGDITETAGARLSGMPVLLAFVDTDNYSPARAALDAVVDNLVVGGAIVFDHYTTTPEFVYTLGERMAAQDALGGRGLLQLHGTGVFVRIA
jgi:O-methyltransferase